MLTTSVFLCHAVDQTKPKEAHMLDRLSTRLQNEGVNVTDYQVSSDETGLQIFLQQQLPLYQWFILFQTSSLVSLSQARQAVHTALKLVEQQKMSGIVRVIATSGLPEEVPSEWLTIPTYDATYDFARAIEKLVLHLSAQEEKSDTTQSIASSFVPAAVSPATNTGLTPFDFDRPLAPPSRRGELRTTLQGYWHLLHGRKKLLSVVSILLLLLLASASLAVYFTRLIPTTPSKSQPAAPPPIYGQVSFQSTNMAIIAATTHTMDVVTIDLHNLKQPAPGNSYYAWLLPDVASENGSPLLLSRFTPQEDGSAHIQYQSSGENNLLATESRFLVTEESTSLLPDLPTADQNRWYYDGMISQTPGSGTSSRLSALDYLRRLFVSSPISMTDPTSPVLSGGLAVWFLQNIHLVFELAAQVAESSNPPPTPALIRGYCVQILDLLDGKSFIHNDVPKNTPWLFSDSAIANKSMLTPDPGAPVPGYIHDIEASLLGFVVAPGVTQSQRTLAGETDAALQNLEQILEQARIIAKQLVPMADQQLRAPNISIQLAALANASMSAYAGQLDYATGSRQGGAVSIFDHLQQLVQFPVYRYPSQG